MQVERRRLWQCRLWEVRQRLFVVKGLAICPALCGLGLVEDAAAKEELLSYCFISLLRILRVVDQTDSVVICHHRAVMRRYRHGRCAGRSPETGAYRGVLGQLDKTEDYYSQYRRGFKLVTKSKPWGCANASGIWYMGRTTGRGGGGCAGPGTVAAQLAFEVVARVLGEMRGAQSTRTSETVRRYGREALICILFNFPLKRTR